MDERSEMWGDAWHVARRFLGTFPDRTTRAAADDLAQDAAIAFYHYVRGGGVVTAMPRLVRTISRRARCRALDQHWRRGEVVADGGETAWLWTIEEPSEAPSCLRVDGLLVPRDWLLQRLAHGLAAMSTLNRAIVVGYYAGHSCRELGDSLGISEDAVRVRLYRARCVLRRKLEAWVRTADHFER